MAVPPSTKGQVSRSKSASPILHEPITTGEVVAAPYSPLGPAFSKMDLSTLRDIGARDTERLNEIQIELNNLEQRISQEYKKIRQSAFWLGANSIVTLGGLIAAPITFGWSLVFSAGGVVLLARELNSYGGDLFEHDMMHLRLHLLKMEAAEISDRLQQLRAELEARSLSHP